MSVKTVASSATDPIVAALTSVPVKYRKLTYTLLSLIIAGVGIWQAAEGNWGIFAVGILSALTHAMSRINTSPPDILVDDEVVIEEDDESEEEVPAL